MKKLFPVGMILGLFLITVFSGCGSGGGGGNPSPTIPTTVFTEDFQKYPISDPWTPAGGWNSFVLNTWKIADGGIGRGNVVIYKTSSIDYLIYGNYSNSNYTVTVLVKPGSTSGDVRSGIVGRFQDTDNFFGLVLTDTNFQLRKYYNDGAGHDEGLDSKPFNFDINHFYTLTLDFNGSTITGSVSNGTDTVNVTATDDGSHGPVITNGKCGLWVWSSSTLAPSAFDDVKIIEP